MIYFGHFNQNLKLWKIKIPVTLVAGAQAWTCCWDLQPCSDPSPCEFNEWISENWWESTVETFNVASRSTLPIWEQFYDPIESVSWVDHFLQGK